MSINRGLIALNTVLLIPYKNFQVLIRMGGGSTNVERSPTGVFQ